MILDPHDTAPKQLPQSAEHEPTEPPKQWPRTPPPLLPHPPPTKQCDTPCKCAGAVGSNLQRVTLQRGILNNAKTWQRQFAVAAAASCLTVTLPLAWAASICVCIGLSRANVQAFDRKVSKDITLHKEDITIQKEDITLQKEDITLQNEDITLQKEDMTLQKEDITLQKEDITLQKAKWQQSMSRMYAADAFIDI